MTFFFKSEEVIGNLLLISDYWPTKANPISGIFVVQQVSALQKLGIQVCVVLNNVSGNRASPYLSIYELGLSSNGLSVVEINVMRFPEKFSSLKGVGYINTKMIGAFLGYNLSKIAKRLGPFDSCVVHGIRYTGLSIKSWERHVKGNTVIVTHGEDPFLNKMRSKQWLVNFIEEANSLSKLFIVVGNPLLNHLVSLGIGKNRIKVIANGTEIIEIEDILNNQRSLAEKRIVISVSNLIKIKGIDLNLIALSNISQRLPNLVWEYHIIGDGPELINLVNLSKTLGIAEHVHFYGRISYDKTMQKVSDADIFSLPSWGEAFGIVYLEAMMRMRPVIGCFENGAADIIIDGVNGLLVPPKNTTELADKLEALLLSPDLCQKLGQEGRKTAEKFSWQRNALKVLEAIGID